MMIVNKNESHIIYLYFMVYGEREKYRESIYVLNDKKSEQLEFHI